MADIKPYAKAVTGAVVAALSTAAVALQPTQSEAAAGLTTSPITGSEGVGILIAFFTGLALVWAIPNKDEKAKHQNESVQPPEDEGARLRAEHDKLIAAGIPESHLVQLVGDGDGVLPDVPASAYPEGAVDLPAPELETEGGAPLPGDPR